MKFTWSVGVSLLASLEVPGRGALLLFTKLQGRSSDATAIQSAGYRRAWVFCNSASNNLASKLLALFKPVCRQMLSVARKPARICRHQNQVLANTSLNRTRYGSRRKPGPRQSYHGRSPGLRRLPPRSG